MTTHPDSREVTEAVIEEMVRLADPAWTVRDIAPAERGFCSVYRVSAEKEESTSELYLKISPDGRSWGIPVEARIQAVLGAQTSIPVPEVLSVVDDHETLPTPFYLMRALSGTALPYEQVAHLDDEVLGRVARETGTYLAELHSIRAVNAFGQAHHDGHTLAGGVPAQNPDQLVVTDSHERWTSFLDEYAGHELDRHANSRFAELTPQLQRWIEREIESLDGPFEPVLGRNDHGLHNLLVDPETGTITGMLDWNYTLAVPPAFDVEFAVYLYSGAFLAGLPAVADRRALVREALFCGYRERSTELFERVRESESLYEILAMIRIMNDFESLDVPEGQERAVTERITSDVQTVLCCGSGR